MENTTIRYLSFKPLTNELGSIVKKWVLSEEAYKNQNSSVCFNFLKDGFELLISGFIEIEGKMKPSKSYVLYDNQTPCGYFHFYQASESFNTIAALSVYFFPSLSEDLNKEMSAIELFLNNYIYPDYKSCIVDIDSSNKVFIDMFQKINFKIHTRMNDFLILIHHSN